MDIKDLVPVVLLFLFVGMLLGVGALTLDKFGRAARTTTTVIDTANNLSVTGTVDFTTEYCLEVTAIDNTSTSFDVDTYNATFSDADGCVLSYSAIAACANPLCNITYTYGATTPTATAMINTNSAITPIASTWMSLLVTVVILSIILGLVINSFAGRK